MVLLVPTKKVAVFFFVQTLPLKNTVTISGENNDSRVGWLAIGLGSTACDRGWLGCG